MTVTRLRIQELESKIAQLESVLGSEKTTEESWCEYLSQELRDQFAARALLQEWGDAPRALLRLGFDCPKRNGSNYWTAEVWALADRIFKTPGCQAILNRDLADLEAQKQPMLQRLMQIAQTSDDTNAVKAATQLAKIMGLNKADQGVLPAGAAPNIFIQLGNANGSTERHRVETYDADAVIEASEFLVHEPGEATVVDDSEETVALHA